MIDWDRYDLQCLPLCDGQSIDAIRVVFPYGKQKEGILVGKKIAEKGYKVFYQAANTLAYSDKDLIELAEDINQSETVSISIVDTFGAMYGEDVERIASIMVRHLRKDIKLGLHTHNNQQLAFANTIHFVKMMETSEREIVIDSSLCGMGRGAGNATTELLANFLNERHHGNYEMNAIMDAIDVHMEYFKENYTWGYSTRYFIAGIYQCHVNNVAYLMKNHRTTSKDMRNIIESLSVEERRKYDYDLLEKKYMENQNRLVDDEAAINRLRNEMRGRIILLIAPGKSTNTEHESIQKYIEEYDPIVIGVNAVNPLYSYDYLFFISDVRYRYAKENYADIFEKTRRIILSNIKTEGEVNEFICNFNRVIKRSWEHFDNAVIACLCLLNDIQIETVLLAGFDPFEHHYNDSYCDPYLPTLNPDDRWDELNAEIRDMYLDLKRAVTPRMKIQFITASNFDV